MSARAFAAGTAVAGVLLGSRVAGAREVEPIHLRYAAPAMCPAEGELVSEVVDLGTTFRTPVPGEAARSFGVVLEKTERGFSGSLSVRSVGGDERVRTVTSVRCDSAVRALGLIMAMALEDVPPSPPAAEPSPEPVAPPLPPDRAEQTTAPDDPGGIAATVLWANFDTSPSGVGVMAVARGATRLGAVAAVSRDELADSEYQISPTHIRASGHGLWARAGAVAAWGAPWSRTEWVGFAAEAGVRGGVLNGEVWSVTTAGTPCAGFFCTTNGPHSPETWRYISPYVAGTLVVQILPKLPVRPVVGLSVVWSGDYRGASSANFALGVGLAWRAW